MIFNNNSDFYEDKTKLRFFESRLSVSNKQVFYVPEKSEY